MHLLPRAGGVAISIHALLAESDQLRRDDGAEPIQISIHALLAESDPAARLTFAAARIFLSTLSLRRATGGGGLGGSI